MATITHLDWLDGMLGNPTHSVVDIDTDVIDASLLDAADAGTITAAFVDYDEVNAADVLATGTIPSVSSITGGVVTLSGAMTFSAVAAGDEIDYLTVWKNLTGPTTSPLIITWDNASTGIPVTPNGGDIIATWGSDILVTLA
jgi:hypothetical protein